MNDRVLTKMKFDIPLRIEFVKLLIISIFCEVLIKKILLSPFCFPLLFYRQVDVDDLLQSLKTFQLFCLSVCNSSSLSLSLLHTFSKDGKSRNAVTCLSCLKNFSLYVIRSNSATFSLPFCGHLICKRECLHVCMYEQVCHFHSFQFR